MFQIFSYLNYLLLLKDNQIQNTMTKKTIRGCSCKRFFFCRWLKLGWKSRWTLSFFFHFPQIWLHLSFCFLHFIPQQAKLGTNWKRLLRPNWLPQPICIRLFQRLPFNRQAFWSSLILNCPIWQFSNPYKLIEKNGRSIFVKFPATGIFSWLRMTLKTLKMVN